MTSAPREQVPDTGIAVVLKNRPFLLLWLAQAVTQVGGNMVLYGLTVIVVSTTDSNTAVSALILSFLVPAVLFSAVAGVYVDRIDRRLLLVVTNAIRGVAFVLVYIAGANLPVILLLTIFVSTVTVFFAPAEAAMIPYLVPRRQLLAANALFTLTLNAAFALGFALLGPLVVTLAGADQVILIVAMLYLAAAAMCLTLPPSPPARAHAPVKPLQAVADAERAVESTLAQLREGLEYIRSNRAITWSLVYLGIASSLIGVLGVLGPDFARETLGLQPKDFVVVVLPLGAGIVMGILLLNSYGKYLPRRRVIEVGMIALGVALALLSVAGPISRFLQSAESSPLIDLSALTSLLAIVVLIAFFAGIAYAIVAIPAQTQLAEDLPEDVRGRVFGVLNMLISVSSFLPIIIVGPISDVVGTGTVIFVVAILIGASGVVSVIRRGPLKPAEWLVSAESTVSGVAVDPIGAMTHAEPPGVEGAYSAADEANGDVAPWLRTRRAEERKAREEGREVPGVRSRVAKAAARISRRRAAPGPASPSVNPSVDPSVDPSAETVLVELPDATDDESRRGPG